MLPRRATADEEVLRIEVRIGNAHLVCRRERGHHLTFVRQRFEHWQAAAARRQLLGQGRALEEFVNDERPPVHGGAGALHRCDVRMPEAAERLRFEAQCVDPLWIAREPRSENPDDAGETKAPMLGDEHLTRDPLSERSQRAIRRPFERIPWQPAAHLSGIASGTEPPQRARGNRARSSTFRQRRPLAAR